MCHYTGPRSSFGSPRLCLTRRTSCRRGNMKSVRIPTVYIVTDGFRGPFIVVCTQPPSSLPNGRCSFRGRSTDNWERLVSHLVTDPPPHHNRLLSLPSSPFPPLLFLPFPLPLFSSSVRLVSMYVYTTHVLFCLSCRDCVFQTLEEDQGPAPHPTTQGGSRGGQKVSHTSHHFYNIHHLWFWVMYLPPLCPIL